MTISDFKVNETVTVLWSSQPCEGGIVDTIKGSGVSEVNIPIQETPVFPAWNLLPSPASLFTCLGVLVALGQR